MVIWEPMLNESETSEPMFSDLLFGRQELLQTVLDHDREPEGDQQRSEHAAVQRRLQQRSLQYIAEYREDRHDQHE